MSKGASGPHQIVTHSYQGISLMGCTFLILLTLKLLGKISMSWWIVTMPLWVTPVLAIAAIGLFCVIIGVVAVAMVLIEHLRG